MPATNSICGIDPILHSRPKLPSKWPSLKWPSLKFFLEARQHMLIPAGVLRQWEWEMKVRLKARPKRLNVINRQRKNGVSSLAR
jgi:hypothetical protein